MRKPCLGRDRVVDFNVTPMIDVVFLLIIFFLVSSHLVNQETPLQIALPSAESREDLREQRQVTLNLTADGVLHFAGETIAPQKITQQQIAPRLQQLRQTMGDALAVRIRADRAVPFAKVQPLLLACTKAKLWNVAFAVEGTGQRQQARNTAARGTP